MLRETAVNRLSLYSSDSMLYETSQPRKNCTHRPSCTTEGMRQMKWRPTLTERNRNSTSTTNSSSSGSRRSVNCSSSRYESAAVLLFVVTDGYLFSIWRRWDRGVLPSKNKIYERPKQGLLCWTTALEYGTSTYFRTYFLDICSTLRRSFPQTYNLLLAAVLQ